MKPDEGWRLFRTWLAVFFGVPVVLFVVGGIAEWLWTAFWALPVWLHTSIGLTVLWAFGAFGLAALYLAGEVETK